MMKSKFLFPFGVLLTLGLAQQFPASPRVLDERFIIPDGFHIYRLAEREATGGSYDICFDGEGRLLVGDGNSVRRLKDKDGDGILESFEIIAKGLGGRGPQGLLVYGDRLYAVGGDGVQLFTGYKSGKPLKHAGRLGAPFHTGGDHAAHTLLRGLDGYIYLVTGDGGGTKDRKHITEETSPVLFERSASVFRFDPSGKHWECVSAGGRNPPSLGMNYLGELFSMDSDMEWHVDLPWYRPVRLNHWLIGGDNGWQGVGAFKPYFIDNLPEVLDVGRGSPDWGQFYEHHQFPKSYHDAFIVCDYRWKSATKGNYNSSGRLVAFHLKRDGARWTAKLEELAKAKSGAQDTRGRPINFALVDIEVAPDGSIVLSDHNQGLWRLFYDPDNTHLDSGIPPLVPTRKPFPTGKKEFLKRLLTLPQPISEWTRLREQEARGAANFDLDSALSGAVSDSRLPLRQRLRALRLLSPDFHMLSVGFIERLTQANSSELRGQAAWLIGLRGKQEEQAVLLKLLEDSDPFVRRRATEALCRSDSLEAAPALVARLSDPVRLVRYSAMTALAHRPLEGWIEIALKRNHSQTLMRALVSGTIRRKPLRDQWVFRAVDTIMESPLNSIEQQLDFLRVLSLFHNPLSTDENRRAAIHAFLLERFPANNDDLQWELARVIGEYGIREGFGELLQALLEEENPVTQFHLAKALAKIPGGWNKAQQRKLVNWLTSTQTGWFSEFPGKGLQFPGFWSTVLKQMAERHGDMLVANLDNITPSSLLGRVVYDKLVSFPSAFEILTDSYRDNTSPETRLRLAQLLKKFNHPGMGPFLEEALDGAKAADLRNEIIATLAARSHKPTQPQTFVQALLDGKDETMLGACADRIVRDNRPLAHYRSLLQGQHAGTGDAVFSRLLNQMFRHAGIAGRLESAIQILGGTQRTRKQPVPNWIWASNSDSNRHDVFFRRSFEIPSGTGGQAASITITCDNEFTAFINGQRIGHSKVWEKPVTFDLGDRLKPGKNWITVQGKNHGGPAGLIARLQWILKNGDFGWLLTDSLWRVSFTPFDGWKNATATPGSWVNATILQRDSGIRLQGNPFGETSGGHDTATIALARKFWADWFQKRFGKALASTLVGPAHIKSDDELHQFIQANTSRGGDAKRGMEAYQKAGCFACHGSLPGQQGRIFGPDLAGVTLRLNQKELADALVYPSKQVAERFQATRIETTDGNVYTGFITEQTTTHLSFTDNVDTYRLKISEVKNVRPQETSLMPARLLNHFSDEEMRDMLGYLGSLK